MDYTSFASAPFPTRMESMGTGYDIGIQDILKRAAQQQAMQHENVRIQQAQANLERYLGMTPGEVAQSQLKGADSDLRRQTPGFLEGMMKGDLGDAQSRESKGRVDIKTEGDRIVSSGAKSRLDETKSVLNHIDMYANIIAGAEQQSPILAQHAWSQMRASLPPGLRDAFPETYTPDSGKGLQRLREKLAFSAEHIAAMDKQAEELASRERVGAGHDAATRYSADRREAAAGASKRAEDVITSYRTRVKDPVQRWQFARAEANNPQNEQWVRDYFRDEAERNYATAQAKLKEKGQRINPTTGEIEDNPLPNLKRDDARKPGAPAAPSSQGSGRLRPGVTREQ